MQQNSWCMDRKIIMWLCDILNAVNEIDSYFTENEKRFQIFEKDLKTRRAVERNLEIIGEALHRILKVEANFPVTHARKIVNVRNKIIHGYDEISNDVIWSIIVRHLPILRQEIEKILET